MGNSVPSVNLPKIKAIAKKMAKNNCWKMWFLLSVSKDVLWIDISQMTWHDVANIPSACLFVSVPPRWTALCLRAGSWFRDLPSGSPSCSGWIWSLWWWWAGLSTRRRGPMSQWLGLVAPRGWWSGVSSWLRLCSSTLPRSCHSSLPSPSSCCMKPHMEPGDCQNLLRPQFFCLSF